MLRGNRSWRVETPRGAVLQKLYGERSGGLRAALREALISLAGAKTSARAAARCATERRLLAKWRAAGFDVPLDRTAEFPELGGPRVAVIEFVEGGRPLWDVLVRKDLADADRDALLGRFAAQWGRRHAAAIAAADAELVQEHGSLRHVLAAGGRLVTIDLEQAFRPRRDVRPLVAKEIAATLRSHWKRVGEERFARDLRTLAASYPDAAVLRLAADEYLRSPSALRRLLWRCDRALRGRKAAAKYRPLEMLDAALAGR
jgi:hypothetical protein